MKQLATNVIAGDKIVVSLAAAKDGPNGQRQTFAGTFNHLGEEIDAQGNVIFGKPKLDLTFKKAAAEQPVFPIDAFNAAVARAGGRPSMESMRIQAEYENAVEAFEEQHGEGAGGNLGDQIGEAVLNYIGEYYGIKRTPGEHAFVDPAQVVVRPAYRVDNNPVVFSVTLAPVWGVR